MVKSVGCQHPRVHAALILRWEKSHPRVGRTHPGNSPVGASRFHNKTVRSESNKQGCQGSNSGWLSQALLGMEGTSQASLSFCVTLTSSQAWTQQLKLPILTQRRETIFSVILIEIQLESYHRCFCIFKLPLKFNLPPGLCGLELGMLRLLMRKFSINPSDLPKASWH